MWRGGERGGFVSGGRYHQRAGHILTAALTCFDRGLDMS